MPYLGDSAIARFYDGDYGHLRTPTGDVAFYVEEARRSGGPVLELGCGTGRILIPVAEAGVEITGLDSSEAMLARLRTKLPEADVHVADMRDFDLGRTFALVTIPFRALGHVTEAEDHVRIFANVRRHLAPEGRLVFDFFHPNPAYLTGEGKEESLNLERTEAGLTIRRYARAVPDVWRQVQDVTFRWEVEDAEGRVEEHVSRFEMRWFHRFELEHLLARTGFVVEALYGGFDRRPFAPGAWEQVFLAKPAPRPRGSKRV